MRVYFLSLNRIRSGTIKIEQWIRESDTSGNDRSRFTVNVSGIFSFDQNQYIIIHNFIWQWSRL
jgi:hypothetical protein